MRFRGCLFVVLLKCMVVVTASAQIGGDPDVLSKAKSLSTGGQYADVVAILEPFVQQHPGNVEAWLLLAQHRYWTEDIGGARRTYEEALQHHHVNLEIRLAYARFLMENGEVNTATEILQPVGADDADAEAIRGKMAWWAGDLSAAARHFRRALATNPDHSEAKSALSSIMANARPWIRIAGQSGSDSQPLSQRGAATEAGLYITPLQTVRTEVTRTRFKVSDSARSITSASAGYKSYWPAARLETELVAGVVWHTDSPDWTGRLDAGVRLPYGMRAGVRWRRTPYLYTEASISERIITSDMQVSVSADRAGWLGEAVLRRERFPDENTKDVLYGWLLAPLIRTETLTLRAGYAYGYQNSAEHRFAAVITSAPAPGRPPEWEGRYIPYYTPLNQTTHSVTGNIALKPPQKLTLRASGSYGFLGSEKAPFIYFVSPAPLTGVYDHEIRPWDVRASIAVDVSPTASLQVEGTHMATTWYDATAVNLSLYARF